MAELGEFGGGGVQAIGKGPRSSAGWLSIEVHPPRRRRAGGGRRPTGDAIHARSPAHLLRVPYGAPAMKRLALVALLALLAGGAFAAALASAPRASACDNPGCEHQ